MKIEATQATKQAITKTTTKLIYTAFFLAIAVVAPQIVHSIPDAGITLSPMHIPVLLAGLMLGAVSGGMVGLLAPFLSSIIFGMPGMVPVGYTMMIELAIYGVVGGLLINKGLISRVFKKENTVINVLDIMLTLVIAMLAGRIGYGLIKAIITEGYSLSMLIEGTIVDTLPAIIIQFLVIPPMIYFYKKSAIKNNN